MSYDTDAPEAIAVVGMAGRFPGADSVAQLWRNLRDGVESIEFFSAQELEESGIPADLYKHPDYVPAKGRLSDPELFDAELFGFSPREAEVLDPQHRIFLEVCWQALEDAGYDPTRFAGRAGIYAGASTSTYLLSNIASRPDVVERNGLLTVRISTDKDSLPTWVAYKLDLRGPSVNVQTACSTSLTAVHMASQGLLDGECDLALAGGVAIGFPSRSGYVFQEGGIQSADGHCRPFDAAADGTVPGDGAGIVVLRRLSDALEDGDTIRAVIRASAATNDGARRVGFTAPGVEGQMRAIAEAMTLAEIDPESVGYVETHGSGTKVGDPIEVQALTGAFRRHTSKNGFCALGSVKANIGHLDAAAGVTGLIKTVCALDARTVPPCAHFSEPNPECELETSPFYVPTSAAQWPANGTPRRAGVSSFGIGGANVHAVLEEAPEPEAGDPASRPWQLLPLSARSAEALGQSTEDLADYLEGDAGNAASNLEGLADVAFTLTTGRRRLAHRAAVICRDRDDALAVLRGDASHRLLHGRTAGRGGEERAVAFLFPGLGDHHAGMTRELYRSAPVFRTTLDDCAERLRPRLGLDLREVLYPGGAEPGDAGPGAAPGETKLDMKALMSRDGKQDDSPEDARLAETQLAQPIVFAVEYALAQQLIDWGLKPRAMIGYSLGEYVAATVAGVFPLDDALALVAERAAKIAKLPAGAMLAVPLPEADVRQRVEGFAGNTDLDISAVNGDSLTVIGGPPKAVAALAGHLDKDGVATRTLRTTHAFHTRMMEPLRGSFLETAGRIARQAPETPFVSNVTGDWITQEQAAAPSYWADHLVKPVRFTQGLATLLADDPEMLLVEVGPGQALATLARQHADATQTEAWPLLPDRRDGTSELAHVLTSTARLWLAGAPLDAEGFFRGERRRRRPLPTYPFERQRYWVEPGTGIVTSTAAPGPGTPGSADAGGGKTPDLGDWFFVESWERAEPARWHLPQLGEEDEGPYLVLADEGFGEVVAAALRHTGRTVAVAMPGDAYAAPEDLDSEPFTVVPGQRADYARLLDVLDEAEQAPRRVIHLWTVGDDEVSDGPDTLLEATDDLLERGFYSLLALAQALGERTLHDEVEVFVVSSGVQEVIGDEVLVPPKAAVLGPCQVIPQEYAQLRCRHLDLPAELHRGTLELALAELVSDLDGDFVALRGRHRWVRRLEPRHLDASPRPIFASTGVFVLTDGLSETSLHLAEQLVADADAPPHLALLVPADGPQAVSSLAPSDPRRARLEALEAKLAELVVVPVDLGDAEGLGAVLADLRQRFGKLGGVVHLAGVAGAGVIQLKEREQAATVLAPKVHGTQALLLAIADLLQGPSEDGDDAEDFESEEIDEIIDFFVIFSSAQVALGGVGQVDVCAANATADALARWATGHGLSAVSIAWDNFRWSHDPAQTATLPEEVVRQLEENLATFGITAEEMATLLERALASTPDHLMVSGRRYLELAAEFDALKSDASGGGAFGGGPSATHERPELSTPFREPENETETALAELWRDAFGLDRVGVDDNFFELGGSSLAALQITTRLRGALGVDLPVAALFEAPTITGLAVKIEEIRQEEAELAEADNLLAEIENLSEEEIALLLAEEEGGVS